MKFVATFLFALLFSCAALSDSYRHVLRHTPHGHVRVVQHVAHHNVRVVARGHSARVAVVYPSRPLHRRVAVVTYRPHYRPVAYVRAPHLHRHHAHCGH